MPDSEDLLVEAARAGDRDALERLLALNAPAVEALIRLRAGHLIRAKESTRDLAQSVCREVLEHIGGFHAGGAGGFRRWLLTLVTRKIANRAEFHRAAMRDVGREAAWADDEEARQLLQEYAVLVASPSGQAMAREELERVESAFSNLSEDDRDLIVQARFVGLSRAEMAEQLGISEAAVRVRLYRALARLATALEPE